jgi:hypothetical protein
VGLLLPQLSEVFQPFNSNILKIGKKVKPPAATEREPLAGKQKVRSPCLVSNYVNDMRFCTPPPSVYLSGRAGPGVSTNRMEFKDKTLTL